MAEVLPLSLYSESIICPTKPSPPEHQSLTSSKIHEKKGNVERNYRISANTSHWFCCLVR